MDLRKEFHDIMEEYGHYVLVYHASRKIRCRCWKEKFQESRSNCPYCMGTGWVGRIKRHKIRHDQASNIISLPNRILKGSIGRISTDTRTFYMYHDANVKEGDLIYEVGWIKNKPTHVIRCFEVNYVDTLRGQGGRIEFLQVSVKEKKNTLDVSKITIRKIGNIINYELKGGEIT